MNFGIVYEDSLSYKVRLSLCWLCFHIINLTTVLNGTKKIYFEMKRYLQKWCMLQQNIIEKNEHKLSKVNR